jgi:hypothetical protein
MKVMGSEVKLIIFIVESFDGTYRDWSYKARSSRLLNYEEILES